MTQKYDLNDQQPKPRKKIGTGTRLAVVLGTMFCASTLLSYGFFQGNSSTPATAAAPSPSSSATPSVSPPVVPETPQEPEKSTAELLKQVDDQMANKQYADADASIAQLLDRVNHRSLTGISLLMKQGEAKRASDSSGEGAELSFREALSGLEVHYGALDARTLPALQGVIAAADNVDSTDYRVGLEIAQRYEAIVRRSPVANLDSSADEAAADAYITQAQQNAAAKDGDCLCSELAKAIKQAGERYGENSYVVALLTLKRAEIDDRDPLDQEEQAKPSAVSMPNAAPAPKDTAAVVAHPAGDSATVTPPSVSPSLSPSDNDAHDKNGATPTGEASQSTPVQSGTVTDNQPVNSSTDDSAQGDDTSVTDGQLQNVLSTIEQRFGPVDYRLEPVLNRLIAMNDKDGNYETADVLIARLNLLHARMQ